MNESRRNSQRPSLKLASNSFTQRVGSSGLTITYTEIRKKLRTGKPLIPVRYVVALLGTMATGFVFALRVNLSVAIVAMVNHTAVSGEEALVRGNYTLTELPFLAADHCPIKLITDSGHLELDGQHEVSL